MNNSQTDPRNTTTQGQSGPVSNEKWGGTQHSLELQNWNFNSRYSLVSYFFVGRGSYSSPGDIVSVF